LEIRAKSVADGTAPLETVRPIEDTNCISAPLFEIGDPVVPECRLERVKRFTITKFEYCVLIVNLIPFIETVGTK
jgi:hypothetical protein